MEHTNQLLVKRALKEMKILVEENKVLKRKIKEFQEKINDTQTIIHNPTNKDRTNHTLQKDEAMKRYTERLKKESLKYAKQKQSKRK